MKRASTFFLRAAVVLIGVLILGLCVFALPLGISSPEAGYYRPILAGLYAPAIPFFIAVYQAMVLLRLIDRNQAFSGLAIKALRRIIHCAVVISALFTAGMPYMYIAAEKDDAPGVIVIGLVIIFASCVVATFAAVLQKLLQNAMDIKAENDLTV